MTDSPIVIDMPRDLSERSAAIARSRLAKVYSDVVAESRQPEPFITVGRRSPAPSASPAPASSAAPSRPPDDELSLADRAARYTAERPRFAFEQLVVPQHLRESLSTAVEALRHRSTVYDVWGLRAIEPAPSAALNLHGPPGTGKSLAAHAIADRLGMPILTAGYAELESKFHSDGPKNMKAVFQAAQDQGALLFVDEADSLLSHRLTDVSQGSDQAINSMRSQIVLCLDAFEGIVVFATNLVSNYDRAFESRVRHFHFTLPDQDNRGEIWRRLLVPSLPRADDAVPADLAERTDGFSGREIKLAIILAAERAAVAGQSIVHRADFETAIDQIAASRITEVPADARPATPDEQRMIEQQLVEKGVIPPDPPPSDAPDQ